MKILGLQSKLALVVWSVVLAISLDSLFYYLTFKSCAGADCGKFQVWMHQTGWPIGSDLYINKFSINELLGTPNFLINLFFWLLISLAILNLIRRKKTNN